MIEAKTQSLETMIMFLKLSSMETSLKMDRLVRDMNAKGPSTSKPEYVISEGKNDNLDKESKPRYIDNPNVPTAEKRMDCLPAEKDNMMIVRLRTMADKIDHEMNVVIQQV